MSGRGLVLSVDRVSAKQGEAAWQVVTDANNRSADGLNRCAVWIARAGPAPEVGQLVEWGPHHVWWGDPVVKVGKIGWEFDPADPGLYSG